MTSSSIRLWYCVAVAVIAAAVADPIVEFASNTGLFGPGTFTDRSTADVIPVLLAGGLFFVLCLALKARSDLLRASSEALDSGLARLLPATFALQIVILYAMETTEQYVVWGHSLGASIWLGGPVLVSLAVHAVACVASAYVVARSVRALARTTLRVIRFIRTLATLRAPGAPGIARRNCEHVAPARLRPVLGGIGERAPPLLAA